MSRQSKTGRFYLNSKSEITQPRSVSQTLAQPTHSSFRYEVVSSFRNMKDLPSLNMHGREIVDFLESCRYRFLFIFGPSGCGKTLLVETILKTSQVSFQYSQSKISENEEDIVYQDLFSMIEEILSCRNKVEEKVILFHDFPINLQDCSPAYHSKYLSFKNQIYDKMSHCSNRNKHIFILNSEIYNPYYLLSENRESKALNTLNSVKILRMQPYGIKQMKQIINHFIKINPSFSLNNEEQQIITEAAGDARKALNLIYYKTISSMNRKTPHQSSNSHSASPFPGLLGLPRTTKEKPEYSQNSNSISRYESKCSLNRTIKEENVQKQEPKVTVFHMLGKFLYAKRYNIQYNPKAKYKKDRGPISRVYTEEELKKWSPKFYFRPVQLFEQSHMALSIFAEYSLLYVSLLHQNYINRYDSIGDIAKMGKLFCYCDSYLTDTLNWYEISQQMHSIMKILLTWGIILYNKNPTPSTGMYRIQRCKYKILNALRKKKLQVLKTYYQKTNQGGRYRMKDIIEFAWRTKQLTNYNNILHNKLIEIVLDRRRGFKDIDSYQNVIKDEEQDLAKDSNNRINQLQQAISNEVKRRRQRVLSLIAEDSDSSDIDEEVVQFDIL